MRILFVTANRIGDAVLSVGALEALSRRHPEARIWAACGPAPAPFFARLPYVTRTIAMPKRRGGLHWFALWRRVVAQPWDLVVDLRGSLLAWGVPARRRRIFRRTREVVHRAVLAARVAGVDAAPPPRLHVSADDRRAAKEAIGDRHGALLALAPAANWEGKRWSAERFAELGRRLTRPDGPMAGAHAVVLAGPGEEAVAQSVVRAWPEAQDLTGALGLTGIAAVLERTGLALANDTGLMHVAAAMGAPTLGLFGPTDERLYGPFGRRVASVRGATPPEIAAAANGDDRAAPALMAELSVDAAERAAERLLKEEGAAHDANLFIGA